MLSTSFCANMTRNSIFPESLHVVITEGFHLDVSTEFIRASTSAIQNNSLMGDKTCSFGSDTVCHKKLINNPELTRKFFPGMRSLWRDLFETFFLLLVCHSCKRLKKSCRFTQSCV